MGHGVDICHSYNAAHSEKKKKRGKKKQPNKIKENKEEEPRNKGSKYKVICFIVLIFLQLKQTNDSPFRLLSSFPVKHEVRA